MKAKINIKNREATSVRFALFLCIFSILFRMGSLIIFSDSMRMKAQGIIEDAPLWLEALDVSSMILTVLSVMLVIISGIMTEGWTSYPSWMRILLPALGAINIMFGILQV